MYVREEAPKTSVSPFCSGTRSLCSRVRPFRVVPLAAPKSTSCAKAWAAQVQGDEAAG